MASSGQITLTLQSVDYYGCPAVCYPAASHRGDMSYNPVFNWSVDDNGNFSVSFAGGNTGWYVCAQSSNYTLKIQYSYDNVNWGDLGSSEIYHPTCTPSYTVKNLLADLTTLLPAMHLSNSCYVRIYTYVGAACPRQCEGDNFPNAYPTEAASQAVAVPVHIEVNWISTLKYNANGGSGAPSDQTHTNSSSTSSYAQTVSSTVPTREHYRFEGWADSASASTAQYQPGGTVTIQKSSPTKTIYAVWTEFYRPGAVFYSTDDTDPWTQVGEYDSHNRTAGNARILPTDGGTVWTEMRTIGAPTELGDTPSIFHDDKWYNQKKLGKE